LVLSGGRGDLDSLPSRARVGTSSLRRRAQLLATRPDLQVLDLRGNVDTRLRKLRDGRYDAVVLAVAGLVRLGHADAIGQALPLDLMLPAVGQGALCVEVRGDDEATQSLISPLNHPPTRWATMAERAFLRRLEGGCQVPIGAFAQVDDGQLRLRGLVSALDGSRLVRDEIRGLTEQAETLGTELAEELLVAGGEEILEEVRRAS
jgi:hydroxymethylbilane synthase